MTIEVFADGIDGKPHDLARPGAHALEHRVGAEIHPGPVQVAAAESRKVQSRFPQGLRGDSGLACRRPTWVGPAVHDGDALAEVCGLRPRLLASRARADHHQVEPLGRHGRSGYDASAPAPVISSGVVSVDNKMVWVGNAFNARLVDKFTS